MMVPYPPLAIYFSALTGPAGHTLTPVLNHGAAGDGPWGSIWYRRGKYHTVWRVYCKMLQTWINWHLCLALPALELRSCPCLPSILQDNLLTSNGLSHFFLSPCEKQRVFLSLPLPLCLFSEMLKHLAASKQGQTTNTWVLGVFPPSPSLLSSAAAGETVLRLWMAPSPRGCPSIRNSLWLSSLDLKGPYSGADPITSWWNDVGPRHRGMMSWALPCHQKKYKLPGAGTVLQGDFCSLCADLRVGSALIPFIPPHWDHHDH